MNEADAVMNEIELGFSGATDESSAILHRFVRATGVIYDIRHNFWDGRPDYRSLHLP